MTGGGLERECFLGTRRGLCPGRGNDPGKWQDQRRKDRDHATGKDRDREIENVPGHETGGGRDRERRKGRDLASPGDLGRTNDVIEKDPGRKTGNVLGRGTEADQRPKIAAGFVRRTNHDDEDLELDHERENIVPDHNDRL